MTEQAKALRLADRLASPSANPWDSLDAANELRRLHQSEREGWRYASELEQDNASLREQNTMLDQKLAELDQQTNPLTEMQYVKALGSLLSEIVCSRGTLRRIVETIEAAHGIGAKA